MNQFFTVITLLSIVVGNIGIAYIVWQLWDHLERKAPAQEPAERPPPKNRDQAVAVKEVQEVKEEAQVEEDTTDLLPEEWLDELQQEGISVNSLLEATAQVLRLRIDDYRDQLVAVEQRARTVDDGSLLEPLIVELEELNKSWLSQLEEVGTYFMDHSGDLTETKEAAEALKDVILNATAQTETTCSNLSMHKCGGDLATERRFVLQELCRLIESAHHLRDCTTDTLLQVAASGEFDAKGELTAIAQQRVLGDYGRLVAAIEQWRSRSDKGVLSLAQLDVDRFADVNNEHGTQMGDDVADRIRLLIEELVQNDEAETLVVRLGGAKFFALFEGADDSRSVHDVETVRQAIEVTTFQTETDKLTFTLSAGIVTGRDHEPATELLARLESFVREAKKSGGNQTFRERASKQALVEPPKAHVEPRVVSLAPALLAT